MDDSMLSAMIARVISEPATFNMIITQVFYPEAMDDLSSYMQLRNSAKEPINDGEAYDYLQRRFGGIVRGSNLDTDANTCFRSITIAVLKKALSEGGENG